MKWWDWLGTLSQGQAAFLGSLVGALVGLLALLLGALFNAHLNRKRDDRLRAEERYSVVAALKAEFSGLSGSLLSNAELLKDHKGGFLVPDLAQSVRVAPHMLPKIGLLDPETIQSVINAYVLVDQYCEKLLLLGGHVREDLEAKTDRRLVHLSTDNSAHVITLNRNLSDALQKTIARLDASLRTKRWWWP
jgi:hypothetical protein